MLTAIALWSDLETGLGASIEPGAGSVLDGSIGAHLVFTNKRKAEQARRHFGGTVLPGMLTTKPRDKVSD